MIAQDGRLGWEKRSREREVCFQNKHRDSRTDFRGRRLECVIQSEHAVPEVGSPKGTPILLSLFSQGQPWPSLGFKQIMLRAIEIKGCL